MLRIIIFFLVFFCSFNFFAQKNYSYAEIDSASYLQCINNDFKAIKTTLENAEKEQIEFYYLYLRAGIVAFNHKSYEFALKQFKRAQLMNPADSDLQLFLYLSLLNTNRFEDAREFGSKLPDSIQKKYSINLNDQFALSVGIITTLNTNVSSNQDVDYINPDKKGADVILNGNVYGTNVQFQINRKFRTYLYQKFSLFQTNSMAIEQIEFANQRYESSYTNLHFQYNIGLAKTFKNGLTIGTGFGYFKTNFSHLNVDFDANGIASFKDTLIDYDNISVAGTIGQRIGRFQPILNFHYNNLYGLNQFQVEGMVNYFPFGNPNFYGSSAFSYSISDSSNQYVFSQKIGVKCNNWLSIVGKYSVGNHYNYMSNLGFISYNTADKIISAIGLDFHLFYKKMEFILGYSYQTREAHYTVYPTISTSELNSYNYKSNNLITTVKWNF